MLDELKMKRAVLQIRLSPEFKEKFDAKCSRLNINASALIRSLMEKWVDGMKGDPYSIETIQQGNDENSRTIELQEEIVKLKKQLVIQEKDKSIEIAELQEEIVKLKKQLATQQACMDKAVNILTNNK